MPELRIERLTYGGSGIGRIDGKACFVPFTAPEDVACVEIVKEKRSYAEASVTALKSPSACRVTPECPYFMVCGGCNWQHISYAVQCAQKTEILRDSLWRSARVEPEVVMDVVAATNKYGYRQRVQLKASYAAGRLSLGFFRRSSNKVVDIGECCPLAVEAINRIIPELRAMVLATADPDRIPQIDLSAGEDGAVAAIFHYFGNRHQLVAERLAAASASFSYIGIKSGSTSVIEKISGQPLLQYRLDAADKTAVDLHYSAESFSQINFAQNRAISALLNSFSAQVDCRKVLDLFCGNGNFSLPLACSVTSVTGVESFARSIELARQNAEINSVANCRFICEESLQAVNRFIEEGETFDLLIMDPPRAGALELCDRLHLLQPKHLVYVSCDPATLGRDLAVLKKSGFSLISVHPVDMFPQTYHLETVVFLKFESTFGG